jgi:hypothetical protein
MLFMGKSNRHHNMMEIPANNMSRQRKSTHILSLPQSSLWPDQRMDRLESEVRTLSELLGSVLFLL